MGLTTNEIIIFCLLKQWKLIFKIFDDRNAKKLTVSRQKAKILTVNRKSLYPIETLAGCPSTTASTTTSTTASTTASGMPL